MSKRKKKLNADLGNFLDQYGRRAHRGHDPNDRRYDRDLEEKIKRMDPEELDAIIRGEEEDDSPDDS